MGQNKGVKLLLQLGELVLLILLWIPGSLLLGLCLIFAVVKLSFILLGKVFRPDLIPIKNVMDNFLTLGSSSSKQDITVSATWILQGKLEINEFRDHFKSTFFSTL